MKAKKSLIGVLFIVLCMCLSVFFVACAKEEIYTYDVTFNVNGHGVAPEAITDVVSGSTIQKPADPTDEEYDFIGWYKDADFEEQWVFETDVVKSDVTLYALWEKRLQKYSVSFNANGHGEAPETISNVVEGSTIQKPVDPSADGYVFSGWYKDTELTKAWLFAADKVNADTVLHARWKQIYPVAYNHDFKSEIRDVEYFSVAETGSYNLNLKTDGGEEGDAVRYILDDENLTGVLNEMGNFSEYVYLEQGVHRLAVVNAPYSASVTLRGIDTPFNKVDDYIGDTYALRVTALGFAGSEKFNVVSLRFGKDLNTADTANAVEFDGEYFTLEARELYGNVYDYYFVKIKINFENDVVSSVDVYAQNGGSWSATAVDSLTRAHYATEFVQDLEVSDSGAVNSTDIEKTFDYAYFDVSGLKEQWLVFDDFEEGTEFWWIDIGTSRKGDVVSRINITAGEPIKLIDEYNSNRNHVAVIPANGGRSVSFTVKTSNGPKGLTADNPIEIVSAKTTINNKAETAYYFTFNAPTTANYKIKVYRTFDGENYTVKSCKLDDRELWTSPVLPSTDAFFKGVETELAEGVHRFVVTSAVDGSITVEIEEVVVGGLESGTFVGSTKSGAYTFEFTFVIDGTTATVTRKRILGTNVLQNVTSDPAELTDNGNGSYSVLVMLGGSYSNFTFTPSADGTTLEVTGDYTFTAAKQ